VPRRTTGKADQGHQNTPPARRSRWSAPTFKIPDCEDAGGTERTLGLREAGTHLEHLTITRETLTGFTDRLPASPPELPKNVEGTRAKLKRLVKLGILTEAHTGNFARKQ
jgi:hypothetical protein